MKKILFVCTGNTCRSPMAAVIFNQLAAQSGLDYVAESAGVAAVGDRPASENAVKAVAEIGLDLSAHRTRFLPSLDLNEYSLFVALNDGLTVPDPDADQSEDQQQDESQYYGNMQDFFNEFFGY